MDSVFHDRLEDILNKNRARLEKQVYKKIIVPLSEQLTTIQARFPKHRLWLDACVASTNCLYMSPNLHKGRSVHVCDILEEAWVEKHFPELLVMNDVLLEIANQCGIAFVVYPDQAYMGESAWVGYQRDLGEKEE
jgi:hypothetical protein